MIDSQVFKLMKFSVYVASYIITCISSDFVLRSTKDFVSFVDSISVNGGGDTAEDVIGGLRVVLNPSHIKWIGDPYGTKVGRIVEYLFMI